jgi:tricorn protease
MKCSIILALAALSVLSSTPVQAAQVDLPRWPSVSPDGSRIVFSWQGDLWLAPSTGGAAVRITNHPADETRSLWSPDGSTLAFESTRDGFRNIWTMPAAGGDATQVTFGEAPCTLTAFTLNDAGVPTIYFDSAREGDFYRLPRCYAVPAAGGRSERVHQAFGSHAAPNGHGQFLFERGSSPWSRRGYRGADQRDVWLFDATKPLDQAFTRLTSFAGNDGQALWCGPGRYLMLSERDGAVNLFRRSVTDAPDSSGEKLTSFADDVTSFDVSADGRTAVLACWDRVYRLDLAAPHAAPQPIDLTAASDFAAPIMVRHVGKDVTEAALSPDGKTMAFVAYGDVFVRSMDEKSPAVRVSSPPSRERDIAWSADGTRLFFVTDADGTDSIVEAIVARTRSELRKEAKSATEPAKPAADKDADAKAPSTAAGDEVAAPATKAATAAAEPKPDAEPKVPVDHRLDPARWTEAVTFEIHPVIHSALPDRRPTPSPDGKSLAYLQGTDLMILNLATRESVTFREGWDPEIEFQWSPDSRWIAFAQDDRDFNRDIWLAPVDGSKPAVNITRHPDNDRSPRFSADGRLLAFLSDRVNNESDVFVVALDKAIEGQSPAEQEAYFKDAIDAAKKRKALPAPGAKKKSKKGAAKSDDPKKDADAKDADGTKDADGDAAPKAKATEDAKEPLSYDLDDAYLRVRRLTRMPGNESDLILTPGGDRVIFSGNDGGPGVFSVKWDGTDQKKVASAGAAIQINLAGDKVVLLNGGKVSTTGPTGGETKSVDFEADTVIDQAAWSEHRFLEAARVVGEVFYDPDMKGLDWDALTRRYLTLARAARTDGEFEWVAARLLGELNASHLGVTAPADPANPARQPVGRLGVRTRSAADGFEVTEVFDKGPAAVSPTPLRVGDVIVAVGGEPIAAGETLERRLRGKVGQETIISVRRGKPDGASINVDCLITPCTTARESELAYQSAIQRNAALVNQWSHGRIGYLHIQSMSQASLDEYERDLCAVAQGKDGLLVDVRNNGGGSTADRVLASLMAPDHAYTVPRGADRSYTHGYPQDRLYIQRWTLPANMLCNEKSVSNAEIISHAFKNLKRGSLVGEQTYGGVISTGATTLTDGTTIRTPFRGWYTPDGTDMENHGAMPTVRVPANPVDESHDFDAQLKAAVDDLMKRLPAAEPAGTPARP